MEACGHDYVTQALVAHRLKILVREVELEAAPELAENFLHARTVHRCEPGHKLFCLTAWHSWTLQFLVKSELLIHNPSIGPLDYRHLLTLAEF